MQFERAQADPETTNRLRRNVAATARLPSSLTVEAAVTGVMCVLTDRLTLGAAYELLRDAPRSIGAMFELCVTHREGKPTARLDRAKFIAKVADHLGVTPAHAELVCSAVFGAVRAELPAATIH